MTLINRLIVFNTVAAAFVVWAFMLGYVQQVFNGDISHISYLIAALFAAGLIATATKAGRAWLSDIEVWLVTLGLIGNVIGFVLALSGIDTGAVGTPEGAQSIAASLLAGMGVAFYSTLTGAVTALWTSVNRRILGVA